MVLKKGKCHYIVIGDNDPSYKIILNNNEIRSSYEETFLGILLDGKLNFDSHITPVRKKGKTKKKTNKKTDQKLRAFGRINYQRTPDQKILLLYSILKSH